MITVLKNLHIVDEIINIIGTVIVKDGLIDEIIVDGQADSSVNYDADCIINGNGKLLMPAFIDLHAHFRDPGFHEKETLESASLAAVAGGYGTVVCMANTKPVIDTIEAASALKSRSDVLGLIDLYPAISLTMNMEGRALSSIAGMDGGRRCTALLSEDGKDVYDDVLFLAAMREAKRLGLPISCHCDAGGENAAVERTITLGRQVGCHIHIAHVSTMETVDLIRKAKACSLGSGFHITCEATPHHIALTEDDAFLLGKDSFGRVNPPLRTEKDRKALISGIVDGTIDAIATDHAPHTEKDKLGGAPGFTGLETSFAVCYTELVRKGYITLQRLSSLMSASPARMLGLNDRGLISKGFRADLVVVDAKKVWTVKSALFKSKGKNTPFEGRTLTGKVLMMVGNEKFVGNGLEGFSKFF
jgi:dihydroorotase